MKRLLILLLLSGCAETPVIEGACLVQAVGQDQNGILAVRYKCERV